MRKVIPFRATGNKEARKRHTAKGQFSPTCQTGDGEGSITIKFKDGTAKMISGKNLEMDVEYRDGIPYLLVKVKR